MTISKINSKSIADGIISAADVADGTLTNAKLADGTIENAKLAGSIANDKLANSSVTINGNSVSLGGTTSTEMFRNIIINGDMSIAQRATSVSSHSSESYTTVDRWKTRVNGQGVWTISQETDVPSGQGFANSLKWDCTTADASPSAGDFLIHEQKFEGQNLQYLKYGTANAESLTVSFWVKSNKTGAYTIGFFCAGNNRHIESSYTINSADTWEKKNVTFVGDTASALANDNSEEMRLWFWLGAGSNFSSGTHATTWSSYAQANVLVDNQVNLADDTANEWYITGVQLEAGTTASDFEFLPVDVNLQRCQRYCYRIQGISEDEKAIGTGFCSTTSRAVITVIHPVTMRAEPTITEVSLQIAHGASSASSVSLGGDTDETLNVSTLLLDADSGSPFTAESGVRGRLANSTSSFIQFDAEL